MDFDEARDENWEPAPDWTEYDERVLQESWEMDSEHYHLTWEEEDWLSRESTYDRPAGPPSPYGESGIGQSGTDVRYW